MADLSGTVDLQSAEHIYTLRELMEIFNLWWCDFLSRRMQSCWTEFAAKRDLAARGEIPVNPTAEEFGEMRDVLKKAEKFCSKVGWKNAENTFCGMGLAPIMEAEDYSAMATIMGVCFNAFEQELQERLFLYVSPEDAELYRNPMGEFSKVVDAFPSASGDAIEACRCYALGRYTACVFHCMGILQYGLYALAHELKVDLGYELKLAEWCFIIEGHKGKLGIEGKIGNLREDLKHLPKGVEKDKIIQFYSDAAKQFRYFKDAWRNQVAHLRKEYDKDLAHSVLTHTREFMEQLSERVKEIPVPPIEL